MHRGYAKLWRKSLDSAVWKNPNLWRFWTWCLMKATHKETADMVGYQCVQLQPGEFIFGRKKACLETGLSEQTIRTCLVSLEKLGNLTIKTTNKFSVLTIVKWEDYQDCNQQVTSKPTNNQPATNQLVTTNKNNNTRTQEEEKKSERAKALSTDNSAESSGHRPSQCSPEEWEKYLAYSRDFLDRQHQAWGPLVKVTESKVVAGAKALDNLVRVQDFPKKVVHETIEWAMADDFWSQQLRSLGSLTKKSKNDELKFSNILAKRAEEVKRAQRNAA